MQQHPVPQQISSYQFRLVGDMTLKQFFQLASGGLLALLIYASPFPGIFKWPLVAAFALGGAAFAFLPIEERPLEVWVAAFFKSIYSPTLFYWKKTEKPRVYFTPDTVQADANAPTVEPLPETPTAPPAAPTPISALEDKEKSFISKVNTLFSKPHTPTAAAVGVQAQTQLQTRLQAIPESTPVPVEKQTSNVYQSAKPEENKIQTNALPDIKTNQVPQTFQTQTASSAQTAQFSDEASPPTPPTQPNLVVGQILDTQGKIIEGAILEIRDEQGRPVRALKSNKAGHFLIVTPLSNGKYQLIAEKQNYKFGNITFEAKGEIIPPIAIKATNDQTT